MKTAKEKAAEWGVSPSTVAAYCASGVIPPAEKVGKRRRWEIPDDWCRPPLSRRQLCFLLDTVDQIHLGANYSDLNMGHKDDVLEAGYRYLIAAGFLTYKRRNSRTNDLANAFVTARGASLLERENSDSKDSVKFTGHVKAVASLGIAKVELGYEVSNG